MANASIKPYNQGQVLWGPLSVYIAPPGTPAPILDNHVENGGTQRIYAVSATNTAGIDAALKGNTAVTESGYGKGAKLGLTFEQLAPTTAWVAAIAVSQDLATVPVTSGKTWTKRPTGVDIGGETYSVYSVPGVAADTELDAVITFGGDQVWMRLGTHQECSVTENGVNIQLPQSVSFVRCAGEPGPQRAIRDTTELMIGLELLDWSAEAMKVVLDDAPISNTPDTDGVLPVRSIPLHRGRTMKEWAVVARGFGLSPYMREVTPESGALAGITQGNMQIHVPYMVQTGTGGSTFAAQAATTIPVEFTAIADQTAADGARYGHIYYQLGPRA